MPELADIFRDRHQELQGILNNVQRHAVRDIIACRTPAMERGTLYCCPECGTKHFIWRSCGNRNCPKCGNDKITKWLAKRQAELLPVDYYMVTFTLPAELRSLCLKFPAKIYNAFFAASSAALKELALDKRFLGGRIGMFGTLQTWRRDGKHHPHIHYLCPGGGLSEDGKYWIYPRNRDFLVAEEPLAVLFKGKFLAKLDEMGFGNQIPGKIRRKKWVADCENVGNGMSSFKYIGAYMQRVFISNKRIEKYDGKTVTFRYEERQSGRTMHRTMAALAFMLMFIKHVLPSGFQKTRYYGLLGNANKNTLAELRLLILTSRRQATQEPEIFIIKPICCRKCGAKMCVQRVNERGPPQGAVLL